MSKFCSPLVFYTQYFIAASHKDLSSRFSASATFFGSVSYLSNTESAAFQDGCVNRSSSDDHVHILSFFG